MAYSKPVSLTLLLCFGLVYCQSVIEFPDVANDDTDIKLKLKNEIQSLGEDDNNINYFKDEDLNVIPLNAVIDVQNANETSYDIFRRRRKSRKRHRSRRHKKHHASRRHGRHKKRHASRRHKSHGRHKKRHASRRHGRHGRHKKRHHASRRHGRHKKRHASRRHGRHGRHKKRHHASRRHGRHKKRHASRRHSRHGRHKKRHHASRRHGRHKKRHHGRHGKRRHGRHGRHGKRRHGRHGRHHGRRQKRHHCHQRNHVECNCGVGECTCTISHDFTAEHGGSESEFCLQASLAIVKKGSGFQTTTASYTTSIGTQQTGGASTSAGGASTSAGGASTSAEAGTTVTTTPAPEAAISMNSPNLSSVEEDEVYYGELQNAGAMYDISFTANGEEVKENDVSLDSVQPLCANSRGYDICLNFYSVNAETGHFCTKLSGNYTEGSEENNLELEVKCMNLSNKSNSQLLGDSFEDSLEE